jgi:Na+/H+ antiporter NhaD/arsenite permease-like protein
MKKVCFFFGLIGATLALLLFSRMFNGKQVLSTVIFSMFIFGTLIFGEFRLAFAFGGIALLLGLNLIDVPGFVEAAKLDVIVFLVGMFLVIGFLEENQFFEYIVARIVGFVGPNPKLLLLAMMIMGTVAAALVDEVTSILFMSGTMLHMTSKYKLNPIPFIIMLVFATNIGSSASSIGNPIGVMIALGAGFSFMEFVRWSAPIALAVNVVTYLICRWWFADSFAAFADAVKAEHDRIVAQREAKQAMLVGAGAGSGTPSAHEEGPLDSMMLDEEVPAIEGLDRQGSLILCWVVFLTTVGLLVTHGLTEKLLGLHKGAMMIGAALTMGCVVLLLRRERARELVERRVDWWTLSFFMMLFASVGTLEHTGVTGVVAQKLIHSTGDNPGLLIQIVGWATGWLSAFLDNVLAVATFMPVVDDVRVAHAAAHPAAPGYPSAIYWLMLFGGTFMGNMTVIGSTANIIACGILEKRGHGTVKFGYWFKIGFIVSIASMAVATLLLGLQTDWFSKPLLAPPIAKP